MEAITLQLPSIVLSFPSIALELPAVAHASPSIAYGVPAVAQRLPAVALELPVVAQRLPAVALRVSALPQGDAAIATGDRCRLSVVRCLRLPSRRPPHRSPTTDNARWRGAGVRDRKLPNALKDERAGEEGRHHDRETNVQRAGYVSLLARERDIIAHMNSRDIVHSDPELMGGPPVFVGTRVPVQSLFDYLEAGDSLDEFLEAFPTVSREQAVAALEIAREAVTAVAVAH